MALIQAHVIYDGRSNKFVGDQNVVIDINCDRLAAYTPRPIWLKRFMANGSDGTPGNVMEVPTSTPDAADLADANTLQGYWIEQDGIGMMVDALPVAAGVQDSFQAQCSSATPGVVAPFYVGGIPSFAPPVLAAFCIARTDDGSASAVDKLALDYNGTYVGNINIVSRAAGVSHCQVSAFVQPSPVGTDTITAGACA